MKNDGGPAFPTSNGGSPDDGMTLRDYFAAQAMQGFLASTSNGDCHLTSVAVSSYIAADAMLAERDK